jgi:type VI secretion system protein ImpH
VESENGTAEAGIKDRLARQPGSVNFFQAIRRLESEHPGKARVGYAHHLHDEVVRFSQNIGLTFQSAAIDAFEPGEDNVPPRMKVNFLGLLGPNGPMPLNITESLYERLLHDKDRAHPEFLDVLQNRIISLFYRSWAECQMTASYERTQHGGFSKYVSSLIGIGVPAFQERDSIRDDAKRFYSAWLAMQTRNAEGLCAIIGEYFGTPAEIEEFIGQWIEVPEDCRCRLGETRLTGKVGLNLIIGKRYWDRQQKFRIRLGPMDWQRYLSMLPSGNRLGHLIDWVRNYNGAELEWDVCLVLRRQEVPRICLGSQGQLGWTTWLTGKDHKFDHDPADLRMDRMTLASWFQQAALNRRPGVGIQPF